jgi:quinol monooxygenase YgiN
MSLYGRTGVITAQPGQRDALLALLLGMSATDGMKGCRAYWIGPSTDKADDIVITEAWDSAEDHMASLKIPAVIEAIGRARPMIAGVSGQGFAMLGGINVPQ